MDFHRLLAPTSNTDGSLMISLGEASDNSPRRQPWDKADGWISPGGATDKAEQFIFQADSFAPARAWLLHDANPRLAPWVMI